jgi:hypothetical protein
MAQALEDPRMPPRLVTLAIVAFWLAMTGWLFYRECWPWLRATGPQPFTIDLADEVQTLPIGWNVFQYTSRPGSPQFGRLTMVGIATSQVDYRELDRTFYMRCKFKFDQLTLAGFPVKRLISAYRVTREGRLKALSSSVTVQLPGPNVELVLSMDGQVSDARFTGRVRVMNSEGLSYGELELGPVPVSERGSVLNPMHPLNRLAGLREGQRWRMPLVDPLGDAVSNLVPGIPVPIRFLDAEVRATTLRWGGQLTTCWLVEYREPGKEPVAWTWVRRKDDLVLQQEATYQGSRLVLQRESGK